MPSNLTRIRDLRNDEFESKEQECNKISNLLAAKEMELTELKMSCSRFQSRYYQEVGRKYVELDELNARIAEIEALMHPSRSDYVQYAFQARHKAHQSAAAYQPRNEASGEAGTFSIPSEGIKKLYRTIAGQIHPDKAIDASSRHVRTRLMARLNAAYAENDAQEMKNILTEWEQSPEAVEGDSSHAKLTRIKKRIDQMKRKILLIDDEILKIKLTDMYSLMIKAREFEAFDMDMLKELAQAVEDQIHTLKQHLDHLTEQLRRHRKRGSHDRP